MFAHLRAALRKWRARRWRSVKTDPPPIGVQVLGHCDYTGMRSVTARRDDIYFRRWDAWHINHPTHWQHIPDTLDRALAPPALPPLYVSTEKR
jgi:hypothetical protein